MNLSDITGALQEIGVSPVKSLGQNFLHDRNLIKWIIERADLTSDDYVVEIGPGLGALTEYMLHKGARVLAIEKDARLVKFLREHFSNQRLEVRHDDALRFDVRTLFAHARVKLLGNLPYYISSQLLLRFLNYPSPISLSLLMLQNEMANRLSASPSTKDYGALTLLVQLHYRVEYLRTIPATVFVPRPVVNSAVVRVSPRDPTELAACDSELFADLVRRGFSQRRKQLGKLLHDEIRDWARAADSLGFDRKVRAEALSLEQWIALTNYARPILIPGGNGMETESFPVVDKEDCLLGAAPRSKVHGDNLRHRAVHIFIFNQIGDVLLQKRSRWKDRHPLLWDSSAAGHVNAGEDYDLAAKRELQEELGIGIPLRKVLKLPASDRTGQEFIWLYCGQNEGKFRPNRSEIDAVRFFPSAVVTDWIAARPGDFAPGFIECWNAYMARGQT
jgi:16S rRNA (adenine1518-N6/adenine1519-N6)-dimethyltransferase